MLRTKGGDIFCSPAVHGGTGMVSLLIILRCSEGGQVTVPDDVIFTFTVTYISQKL